jgi:dihydroflavonol-4-reductase
MKCLVTGGSGFLGVNLIHELVKSDWEVRAIVRKGANIKYIESLPIEIVYGEITNPDDVDKAVAGCEYVFHVAADTSFWKRNFERQRIVNVEVPSIIARACVKHHVKRMIHTSTIDVFGYNPNGLVDESWSTYNYGNWAYNYADTKREGEQKLLKGYGKDLEIVVIYPGALVGPYDFTLQYGRLFFDLRDGNVPGCPTGGLSFCHVTEVAKAHIAAATKGTPGEGYICGGVNIKYKHFFDLIANKFDKAAPSLILTKWMFVAYGYIMQILASFTNKAPDMDPGNARFMSVDAYVDSSKAVRELGYVMLPVQKIIDDAYDWYKDNGFFN